MLSSLTWWILSLVVDIALGFLPACLEREFSVFQCWFPLSKCSSKRFWVKTELGSDGTKPTYLTDLADNKSRREKKGLIFA